ncbi:hypothetical protein, partial [Vibrio anguillarum]
MEATVLVFNKFALLECFPRSAVGLGATFNINLSLFIVRPMWLLSFLLQVGTQHALSRLRPV